MIVIAVVLVYDAVAVKVGIETLHRFASSLVVYLLIHVEAVWSIALGQHLHVVALHPSLRSVYFWSQRIGAEVLDAHLLPCGVAAQYPLPVLCRDDVGIE